MNTLKLSATNIIGNYIGSKAVRTNSGWFKPKGWKSFMTMSYGKKIRAQAFYGGVLSVVSGVFDSESQKDSDAGQSLNSGSQTYISGGSQSPSYGGFRGALPY